MMPLETAHDMRHRRLRQRGPHLLPMLLRRLPAAAGKPQRPGNLQHPVIHLPRRSRRRTTPAQTRRPVRQPGQRIRHILPGALPAENRLPRLPLGVAARIQTPPPEHSEQQPPAQRYRRQKRQPLDDRQYEVRRLAPFHFPQAFVKLLYLLPRQLQPAQIAAPEQARHPVAHGHQPGRQQPQQQQQRTQRPQPQKGDASGDGARQVVQPAHAGGGQDNGQRQKPGHADHNRRQPAPVDAAGGGKPAQRQPGQTHRKVQQQRRQTDNPGLQHRIRHHGDDDHGDPAHKSVANHIQRNIIPRDGRAAPPQRQHKSGSQPQRRRRPQAAGENLPDGKPPGAHADAGQP